MTKAVLVVALLASSLLAQGPQQQKEERTFKTLIVELELDPVSKNKTLKDAWDQRDKDLRQLYAQRISLLNNRAIEAGKDKPDPAVLVLVNDSALAKLDVRIEEVRTKFKKLLVDTLSRDELYRLLGKIAGL